MQSAAENLGVFGGIPHPNLAHPIPLDWPMNLNVDGANVNDEAKDHPDNNNMEVDGWDAWD